jgi:hypothetical protein
MSNHPIPQFCTLGNQFRPRNQFHPIPGIPISFNQLDLFDNDRIPSNSVRFRNSVKFRSIPKFRQTPEFRLALTLMLTCVVKHNYLKQAINSETEFRELGRSGIRRNS